MPAPVIPAPVPQFVDVPQSGQPQNTFDPRADNFLAVQLPGFVDYYNDDFIPAANALGIWMSDAIVQVESISGTIFATANYVGRWVDLSGPLSMPATVSHESRLWVLQQDVVEVSDDEPGTNPAVWLDYESVTGLVPVDLEAEFIAADRVATLPEFFAGTADKVLTAEVVRDARDYVTLTTAASVAIDLNTGINFHLTTTGTHEIAVPTNGSGGVSGLIVIDLGGAHAVTFATGWLVPSTVDLTGTAGTQHALSYARMPGGQYRVSQFDEVA